MNDSSQRKALLSPFKTGKGWQFDRKEFFEFWLINEMRFFLLNYWIKNYLKSFVINMRFLFLSLNFVLYKKKGLVLFFKILSIQSKNETSLFSQQLSWFRNLSSFHLYWELDFLTNPLYNYLCLRWWSSISRADYF